MYKFIHSCSEFVHLEIDLMIGKKSINEAALLMLTTINYLLRKLLVFLVQVNF